MKGSRLKISEKRDTCPVGIVLSGHLKMAGNVDAVFNHMQN